MYEKRVRLIKRDYLTNRAENEAENENQITQIPHKSSQAWTWT